MISADYRNASTAIPTQLANRVTLTLSGGEIAEKPLSRSLLPYRSAKVLSAPRRRRNDQRGHRGRGRGEIVLQDCIGWTPLTASPGNNRSVTWQST